MRECMFYEKKEGKKVQCRICPRNCIILEGKRGHCKVRENKGGKLYLVVYGLPCAEAVDPIEKKPQYHFLPGTDAFSIGTAGCNLNCDFCQNNWMSQHAPEELRNFRLEPKDVVKSALDSKCASIAYTYNDPIVFYEYAYDTAKLAKEKGLKNIFVTNGFINQEPLKELCKYMDGFHIDLKGFTDEYYKKVCNARLQPVLDTLKTLKKEGKWFEIIYLMIPEFNDDMKKIKEMCEWIMKELGPETVIHFSAFFPSYKMDYVDPTPTETLNKAKAIAEKAGIQYVYIGNVFEKEDNTYCRKCKKLLIRRTSSFEVLENNIKSGKGKGACKFCKAVIPGVF